MATPMKPTRSESADEMGLRESTTPRAQATMKPARTIQRTVIPSSERPPRPLPLYGHVPQDVPAVKLLVQVVGKRFLVEEQVVEVVDHQLVLVRVVDGTRGVGVN